MSFIISYNEEIEYSDGGFFTPNGEFIECDRCHEVVAERICAGHDFGDIDEFLRKYKYDEVSSWKIEEYLKKYNIDSVDKIDVYCTSNLSKVDLELYKKWRNRVFYGDLDIYINEFNTEFLVRFLRYDKIETYNKKCITTTYPFEITRYYNYLLMGWKVKILPYFVFDEKGNVCGRDPLHLVKEDSGWYRKFWILHKNCGIK